MRRPTQGEWHVHCGDFDHTTATVADADIRLLSTTTHYSGPRAAFVSERFATPDGEVERPAAHHPGAVAIIARPDPEHLAMVWQYRYPLRRRVLEIPAGTCEPGEDPQDTARRELGEEAGYAAARLEPRCTFCPSVGISDETMIIYEAFDLQPVAPARERGELISPVLVPLAALAEHRRSGAICDAKTLLALALLGFDVGDGPC